MTVLTAKNPEKKPDSAPARPEFGLGQDAAGTTPVRYTFSMDPGTRVKRSELILFTTQLAVMLDSGVVLSDALDAIAGSGWPGKQNTPSWAHSASNSQTTTFRTIVMDVSEAVKGGESFSKALGSYPKVFNSMFVSMVRACEASGRMAEMLRVLSGYLNFEDQTRKRIKAALTYPVIMLVMAIAAMGIMCLFVLPRFIKIYQARSAALPKLTQVLVNLSQMLGDSQIMAVVSTVLILVSMALYYWAGTLSGRRVLDFIKIRCPVLGPMFIDLVITRSMRIMATMVSTGVSILDTIEVICGSCDNYYFQQLWADTDKKIRDGYQFSESIQISSRCWLIAPSIIQMLRAGEKSGRLGEICDKVSVFYEKRLEASIKSVTAVIEPLMITILGAVIGIIAIALLLPVFRISSVVAR